MADLCGTSDGLDGGVAVKRLLLLLMVLMLTLSACTAPPSSDVVYQEIPPAENPYDAPEGDDGMAYTDTVALYLPNRAGQRLIVQYEHIALRHDEHPARAILEALLTYPTNDDVRALTTGTGAFLALHKETPVEVAGGICTVNLASSALQLSYSNLYTVCLSIAATLCELPDINAVNVLIAGQAIAMDITGCLPLGTIAAIPGEELAVLWEQMDARRVPLGEDPSKTPVSASVTLYFPLADGSGMLPETRTMSFPGQHPEQLALEVVNALSAGAQYINDAADMPNLNSLLNVDPIVTDLEDGGRMLTLRFNPGLEDKLRQYNLDMALFLGSVQRTLVTLIPSIASVRIYIGDTLLTSLYSRVHGSLLFPDGIINRQHFDSYVMDHVTLYLTQGDHLSAVQRPVSQGRASSLRILLAALFAGPTAAETAQGYTATLPDGLTDSDILGLSIQDDVLLVNLSVRFTQTIAQQEMNETLLCYSLVNTLCDAAGVQRVRFYFEGDTAGSFSGKIYWGGEFLRNPGLIR